ncbi:MAG: hypothetical protein Ta2B_22750 [Termitinemataceae bacterium]|nr:MAG: hypothetical protein Ta2B_22750 [Termitinemataceae bacterium]
MLLYRRKSTPLFGIFIDLSEIAFLLFNAILIICVLYFIPNTQSKSQNVTEAANEEPEVIEFDFWKNNGDAFTAILNEKVFSGDPVTVVFLPYMKDGVSQITDTEFSAVLYDSEEKLLSKAKFFEWVCDSERHKINAALFTVPSTQTNGYAKLVVKGNDGFTAQLLVNIEERDYESETIALNKRLTNLRTTTDPKRTEEAARLWSILTHTGDTVYTTDTFATPIRRENRRTSFFGDKRVYKYANGKTDSTIHAGIDYGIAKGSKVLACANGLVVLANMRIVTGNSVIVEHLPGVYSIYYHLDEIAVNEGDMVLAGDLLGLSGSTGLSTGPHLHWEIRAGSENTDPDYVSEIPLLDTEALYKKFYVTNDDNAKKQNTNAEQNVQSIGDTENSNLDGASTSTTELSGKDEGIETILAVQAPEKNRWNNNEETFFTMLHPDPRPGDPITVVFYPKTKDGVSQIKDETFKVSLYNKSGRRIAGAPFFKWAADEAGHLINAAVFSVPATESPQRDMKIKIIGDKGFIAEAELEIKERVFELDLVVLNKALTDMRSTYDPKKTEEAQYLWKIYATTNVKNIWTTETFTAPIVRNTRRTSPFGDKRTYRYANGTTDSAIHAGIDYGVPIGTEIAACAAGRVVLARERITTGNSVIIEHYPGVYSIYYHLDSIKVAEEQIIEQGDLIGLSGATGLATGPHLHWEIRIASENTNPDTLCDMPLLNSEALAKLVRDAPK